MLVGMLGIGRSTPCEIVNDTAKQAVTHLMPKYIKVPNEDWIKKLVEDFELIWGFP